MTNGLVLDNIFNLSPNNQKVFEQRGANIEGETKLDSKALNFYDTYDNDMFKF